MDYDEDVVLDQYVLTHCAKYLTALEVAALRHILAMSKANSYEYDAETRQKLLGPLISGDPKVLDMLADGNDAFRRRTRERILRDHSKHVSINRCPRCDRIVRTPKAKQCFWCGHDWHA